MRNASSQSSLAKSRPNDNSLQQYPSTLFCRSTALFNSFHACDECSRRLGRDTAAHAKFEMLPNHLRVPSLDISDF